MPPTSVVLEVSGRTVQITSPDKVFFTARGETKLDLANYYIAVGEPLLRTMQDRPVLMQRFPNGAGGSSFFQKRVPENAPDWLTTAIVSTPNGTTSRALVIADLAPPPVGGEPRLPRVPLVAGAYCRRAPSRRTADRPRPATGHDVRDGAGDRRLRHASSSTMSG